MKLEEDLQQLQAENETLREQIKQRDTQLAQRGELTVQLPQRVQMLEEQAGKDSRNSSLPPSSDRFARQKKSQSLRQKSGKKAGGQQGHAGTTLEMSSVPDEVIALPPVMQCQHCHANLQDLEAKARERRQVVDVPAPRLYVTKYLAEWKQCPGCQGYTHSTGPLGVTASVQYGPRVGAMGVYLLTLQLLPWGENL